MPDTRTYRITLFLNDSERDAFQAVREHDLPAGTAARRILMERVNWLAQNSRKQFPKRGPVNHRPQDSIHDSSITYDTDDSQE